jgi:hypothetical protein
MQKLREQLREEPAPPNVLSRNEAAARLEQELRTGPVIKQDLETEPPFDHAVFSSFLHSHDEDMKTLKQAVSVENLARIVAGLLEDRVKKVVDQLIVEKIGPVLRACAESVDQNNLAFEKLQKEFIVVREAQDKRLDTMQAALDALTGKVETLNAPAEQQAHAWLGQARTTFSELLSEYVGALAEHQTKFRDLLASSELAVDLVTSQMKGYDEKMRQSIDTLASTVNESAGKFATHEETREKEFKGKLADWQKEVDGAKESVEDVVSALAEQLEHLNQDVDLLAREPVNMGYLCQKIKREQFLPIIARINELKPQTYVLTGMGMKKLCMGMRASVPPYEKGIREKLKAEGPESLTGDQIYAGIPRVQNIEQLKTLFEGSKFDPESPLFFKTIVEMAEHLKKVFEIPALASP